MVYKVRLGVFIPSSRVDFEFFEIKQKLRADLIRFDLVPSDLNYYTISAEDLSYLTIKYSEFERLLTVYPVNDVESDSK